MVWVIEGILNSQDQYDETVPIAPTSHYIRPERIYRLGRRGFTPLPKDGKESLPNKPRPWDFRIKSTALPRDWAWQITSGQWTTVDALHNPIAPSNSNAYPIVFTNGDAAAKGTRKTVITRQDQEYEIAPKTEWVVQSGDIVTYWPAKQYSFTFKWIPFVVSLPKSVVGEKKREYSALAKSVGIKLAYGAIFLSHHTHFLVESVGIAPDAQVLNAALAGRYVSSLQWLEQLFSSAKVPTRPDDAPLQEEGEDAARYGNRLASFKQDVGSDYSKYWGHSELEDDWTQLPDPVAYSAIHKKYQEHYKKEGWTPNPSRCGLFDGTLSLTFDDNMKHFLNLVVLGGGKHIQCDLLDKDRVTSAAIIAHIDAQRLANGTSDTRLMIWQPKGINPDPRISTGFDEEVVDPAVRRKSKVLSEVAQHFSIHSYISAGLVPSAIYEADVEKMFFRTPLLSISTPATVSTASAAASLRGHARSSDATNPLASHSTSVTATVDQVMNESPNGSSSSARPMDGSLLPPSPSANQFSIGSSCRIGGTHPNLDSTLLPGHPGRVAAREAANAELEAPPPPKKKLTRRAVKPVQDDQSQSLYSQATAPQIESQSTLSDVDVDTVIAPRKLLKRRAGTQAAIPKKNRYDTSSSEEDDPLRKKGGKKSRMQLNEEDDIAYEAKQKLEKERLAISSRANRARSRSQSPGLAVAQATKPITKSKNGLGVVEEEEEEVDRGVGSSKRVADRMEVDDPTTAQKSPKKKARIVAPASSSPPPPLATSKATNPDKAKPKGKGKTTKVVVDPTLLQLKVPKRKGAEADAEMAAEFNALKLVRPILKPMVAKAGRRFTWGEDDSDEDELRRIREDQRARWDEDAPREPGFFKIVRVHCGKTEFKKQEVDPVIRARWATQVDLKGFRGKVGPDGKRLPKAPPRVNVPCQIRERERPDFGIGPAYADKVKSTKKKKTKPDADFDSDNSSPDAPVKGQTKLNFKAVPSTAKKSTASKSKGKGKQAVVDSEVDELDDDGVDQGFRSSNTLGDDNAMDIDVQSDGSEEVTASKKRSKKASTLTSNAKASSSKSTPAAKKSVAAPASTRPIIPSKPMTATALKKQEMMAITISDDSDDSDSGRGFPGFSTNRATATRKKK